MAVVDGEALRVIREKDGWTATRFAEHVGIGLPYLMDIESGRRTLKRNPALIKKMAVALHVPVSMIELRDEPEREGVGS